MLDLALHRLPRLPTLAVRGKRVLLRVDFNDGGQGGPQAVRYRMEATLPTLLWLLEQGARVGVLNHRGRPQGRVVPELSNAPLASALADMLGQPVEFIPDCIGRMAQIAMQALPPGRVVMLENTRFHMGEQLNQQPFAVQLAQLGDVLVNEAFACAHRTQASTTMLAGLLPTALGLQFVHELQQLERWKNAVRPRVMVLGGNAVLDKLELLQRTLTSPATKVDLLLLAGVVGQTFLAAKDLNLQHSLIEFDAVDLARNVLAEAGVLGCRVHLPRDFAVARRAVPGLLAGHRKPHGMEADDMAQDLGPQTLEVWQKIVQESPSVLWFGSVGHWQHRAFRAGLRSLAAALQARTTPPGGLAIVAGNGLLQSLAAEDLLAPLRQAGVMISTGGGALQQILSGHPLPAVQAVLQPA